MSRHRISPFTTILTIICLSFLSACAPGLSAELVLTNGKVVTVDADQPSAEALAIRAGRILEIGSSQEISKYIGDKTQILDLDGKLAIPGFIEGHAHFTGLGSSKLNLDLTRASDWVTIVGMVRDAVSKTDPGTWILGRGWHQEKWRAAPDPNVDGLPIHTSLSAVSPANPVMLTHASGHACFANAKAMELAGIKADTRAPDGGEIVRDSQGHPTGAFRETAQGLVRRAYELSREKLTSEEIKAETLKIIELASDECLAKGVTSFQDAGSPYDLVEILKEEVDQNRLRVRLYVMLNDSNSRLSERLKEMRLVGYGNGYLTVRAIKRLVDGALGSHGAWLLEPYSDLPASSGLNTTSLDSLEQTARIAIENDFQLCVHAIGDRANREVLDIYEAAFDSAPSETNYRWRIEHVQHLNSADIPRFHELGVIAAMQGVHATSDGPWVIRRLGENRAREGAYVWRSLLDSGTVIVNGTDAPVEDVSPLESFYASVTRRTRDDSTFFENQKMSREEALKSYTLAAAYGAFEETDKGSLTPGKLADITVLSEDIMTVPEDKILETKVLYTIVGGKIEYAADQN